MSDERRITLHLDPHAEAIAGAFSNAVSRIAEALGAPGGSIAKSIDHLADAVKRGGGGGDNTQVLAKLDQIITLLTTDPAEIQALINKLKASSEALKSAVDAEQQ